MPKSTDNNRLITILLDIIEAVIILRLLVLAALVGGGYLLYRAVAKDGSGSDQVLKGLRLAYSHGDLTDEESNRRKPRSDKTPERTRERWQQLAKRLFNHYLFG